MKKAINNKGTEISYDEKYEEACRVFLKKPKDSKLTDKDIFNFFYSVYENAINKGQYEE